MTTVTLNGEPLTIIGSLPNIGSQAPDFIVTKTDLSEIHLKNYLGNPIILNIFPSLDTSTCASAMVQFNKIAAENPELLILCISADLPFAQKRFCSVKHLDNIHPVSIFRHPEFGTTYGVTITSGPLAGLLARAVILLDAQGKVMYTELVDELVNEPNYKELVTLLAKKDTVPH